MKNTKKLCIFTGTRAEYGLLKPLITLLKSDPFFKVQLLVTGSHLSEAFGLTYKEIEADGFEIDKKVDLFLQSDSQKGIATSMGTGLTGFAEAMQELTPDAVLILGDRYEAFAMASVATLFRIPIIHLYGGETTEGATDEAFRHSITKMSVLHFVTTETYKKRVIQLGEDPSRVFNVGALGIDSILQLKPLKKEELEEALSLRFKKKNLLITFHPETLSSQSAESQIHELLNALDAPDDTLLIFTKANADAEGQRINVLIEEYVQKHPEKAKLFASLGTVKYLSLMHYVDAVVGNSSSGILEAPSFKIGTINIGDRQAGRIQTESVINCKTEFKAIREALKTLYSPTFQNQLQTVENKFGNGTAATQMQKIILSLDLKSFLKKKFYDIA